MRLEIESRTPIERWRFDNLRDRYQHLSTIAPNNPDVENVVHDRLALLTHREQAAKAAAAIQAMLAKSHDRDRGMNELRHRLRTSAPNSNRSRTYQAVGFMQSSAQKIDGHKLFLLIGKNGETLAFLDIPPGLDPEPALAHKVGVRGVAHYNAELQSRLITVRNLDKIDATR